MLEDLFDEKVEDVIRRIKLLDFLDFLFGQRNQIVEGVLISLKPNSLGHFLNFFLVVDSCYLIQMHILGPLLWLNSRA